MFANVQTLSKRKPCGVAHPCFISSNSFCFSTPNPWNNFSSPLFSVNVFKCHFEYSPKSTEHWCGLSEFEHFISKQWINFISSQIRKYNRNLKIVQLSSSHGTTGTISNIFVTLNGKAPMRNDSSRNKYAPSSSTKINRTGGPPFWDMWLWK